MHRLFRAVLSVVVVFLVGAPHAPASEEVGSSCVANASKANWTVIGFFKGDPAITPQVITNGVITHWKVRVAPGMGPFAQQLVVIQQVSENERRKVAESSVETVVEGSNEFATRMPIQEYGQIGLHGPVETLYCDKQEQSTVEVVEGDFPVGQTRAMSVKVGIGAAATVIIESDGDGDGYGDRTQDRCPWGWSYRSDCPIAVSVPHTTVKPHAILVEISDSAEASIEVFGQVGWRVRSKAGNGSGSRSHQKERQVTVGLSAGPAKSVTPAGSALFRLPLPKTVLQRLGHLSPRAVLLAKLTIRVTDPGARSLKAVDP